MKKHLINQNYFKISFSLFLLFTFVFVSFGQNQLTNTKTEWTRIESENKEVSVSIPSDFLVNTEAENYKKKIAIYGFSKDVEMRFSIIKLDNPKQNLKNIKISEDLEQLGNSFEINGLSGKNLVSRKTKFYNNTFFLASKDFLYQISVIAKLNPNKEIIPAQEVARFINSIKVNGQQLIVPAKQYTESADKIVAASSLKASPEVLEALERKPDKLKTKFTYLPESSYQKDQENEEPEQRAIILSLPFVNLNSYQQGVGSKKIILQFTLLANGQVGDVTVFSDASRLLIGNATGRIKNIKFIPAKTNGKFVDSQQTKTLIYINR